jgi:tetratricopeptide (TPR) repeat protein
MKPPLDRAETEPAAAGAAEQAPVSVARWSLGRKRTIRLVAAFILGLILAGGLGWAVLQPFAGRLAAGWILRHALQRFDQLDFPGALAELDRAVELLPNAPGVCFLRAKVRLEAGDVAGALAEYNRLIELNPHFAGAYAGRSVAYQRLDRHREAIEDLNKVIELRPPWDAQPLNQRAYARALAAETIDRKELEAGLADIQRAIELAGTEDAAFLDTRGYLLHLVGRHDEALADLDRAVSLAEADRKAASESGPLSPREARLHDHTLAVTYHHRGLVHRALGHTSQAEKDLKRGDELGYDPAKGVW